MKTQEEQRDYKAGCKRANELNKFAFKQGEALAESARKAGALPNDIRAVMKEHGPAGRASGGLSSSTATQIRIELSRKPPSHFKSAVSLDEDQINERKARLAAYEANRKRQQGSKFGRLLAAAGEAAAATCEEGDATRKFVRDKAGDIKAHVTAEMDRTREAVQNKFELKEADNKACREVNGLQQQQQQPNEEPASPGYDGPQSLGGHSSEAPRHDGSVIVPCEQIEYH